MISENANGRAISNALRDLHRELYKPGRTWNQFFAQFVASARTSANVDDFGNGENVWTRIWYVLQDARDNGWLENLLHEIRKSCEGESPLIVGHTAERLLARVAAVESALYSTAPEHLKRWQKENPYRGLLSLREHDTHLLFGRDEDVTNIITALSEKPKNILLALGASGVGKSSLIFAGVFAALENDQLQNGSPLPANLSDSARWPRLVMTPGTKPVRRLAGAFLAHWLGKETRDFREEADDWQSRLVNGEAIDRLIETADIALSKQTGGDPPPRYLIYVDQGEELYTRAGRNPRHDGTKKETSSEKKAPPEKEARRFSELLAEAATHERLTILMSARSDFLDRLQADTPIHKARHLIDIEPLSEDALFQMAREPAKTFEVELETGLDTALVASTREEEGGLPLLSDTLETLWQEMQQRGDGTLKWTLISEGDSRVNVARKLSERADAFVTAHADQEADLRRLFCVRLAHVPHQGPATRQTFYLDADDVTDSEKNLVTKLSAPDQRILTTGAAIDDEEELTNDAVADDKATPATKHDGRPYAEIAHEALLGAWPTLARWVDSRPGFYAWMTVVEANRKEWEKLGKPRKALLTTRPLERARSFLDIYPKDITENEKAFVLQSVAWYKLKRNTIYTALATAIMALAGLLLLVNSSRIESDKLTAESNLRILVNHSNRALNFNRPVDAMLVALNALPQPRSFDAQPYLHEAEQALYAGHFARHEVALVTGHRSLITHITFSPDGNKLATASEDHTIRIWDTRSLTTTQAPFTIEGNSQNITAIAFNDRGTRLAGATYDGIARIWDLSTRQSVKIQEGTDPITDIAFDPTGTRFTTVSSSGAAWLSDATTGDLIQTLSDDSEGGISVTFSPNGEQIVSAVGYAGVTLWNSNTGTLVKTFNGSLGLNPKIVFNRSGTRVAAIAPEANTGGLMGNQQQFDRTVLKLWNVKTGKVIKHLFRNKEHISYFAFNNEGSHIATGSSDGVVQIWNSKDGNLVKTLTGHTKHVNKIAFSPDGKRFITTSHDKVARIWSAINYSAIEALSDIRYDIDKIIFSPDGGNFATLATVGLENVFGGARKKIRVWNSESGKEVNLFNGVAGDFSSIAFNPNGNQVVTVTSHGYNLRSRLVRGHALRVWSVKHPPGVITVERAGINVKFAPSGQRIASSSWSGGVKLWNSNTGSKIIEHKTSNEIKQLEYTPDGTRLIAISEKDTVLVRAEDGRYDILLSIKSKTNKPRVLNATYRRVATLTENRRWQIHDTHTGNLISTLEWKAQSYEKGVFNLKGDRLVTYSSANHARLWDSDSGLQIAKLDRTSFDGIVFSPDGTKVLTSHLNKTQLWNAHDGTIINSLEGQLGEAVAVAFSPDNERIAIGYGDKPTQLWDGNTGVLLGAFHGKSAFADEVVFGSNSNRIATAKSGEQAAHLWNGRTGKHIASLSGHTLEVREMEFNPDGTRLVTRSRSSVASLWNTLNGERVATLGGHAGHVRSAKFSSNGLRLVTFGAEDSRALLWDGRRGHGIATLEGHSSGTTHDKIRNVEFNSAGTRIATSDANGDVRIWRIFPDTTALVQHARVSVPRCLSTTQRQKLGLETDPPMTGPPHWCVTGASVLNDASPSTWKPRWPYKSKKWKEWLLATRRGEPVPPPSNKRAWQKWNQASP